jgi:HK97 gp10 family phage protein
MKGDFELIGQKDLLGKLKKLETKAAAVILKKALRKAGGKIRSQAKMDAPVDSGNLRRSIKVFADKGRGSKNGALIRVGADRKIAPHAHLVEFGTEERVLKKPRTINVQTSSGSSFFEATHTGKMPANPFFQGAYDKSQGRAVETFTNEMKRQLSNL